MSNLMTTTYYKDVYTPSQIIDKILNIRKLYDNFPSVLKLNYRFFKYTDYVIRNNSTDYDYYDITNDQPIKMDIRDIHNDVDYFIYQQI